MSAMKTTDRPVEMRLAWSLAGLVAIAVVMGAGLAGWLDKGVAIFLVMAETGLSWCF